MKTKILKLALSLLVSSAFFAPSQAEATVFGFLRNLFGVRVNNSSIGTIEITAQEKIRNEIKINNKCFEFYKKDQSGLIINKITNSITDKKAISDLKSFGQAMTEGMLLNAEQADLFEVYRKIYFGDPNTSVNNESLKSVTEILKKYPDLKKTPFREYEISAVEKNYESTESLNKYLKSQIQIAGEVRNNLLQIEANLGFWKKIFDYQDLPMPDEIKQMQSKLGKDSPASEKEAYRNAKSAFEANAKKRFETYLNRMISRKNRELLADLKNDKEDYQKKAKSLFTTLKYIQEWMDKKGRNTQNIRQAMVDLIHTVGFGNQATQILLKSKNAMERIEGLKKILDERDAMAMDLGFAGHFQELQANLKIEFPTGLSKNENPSQNIQKLEQEILDQGKFTTKPTETVRVRSLSIQEAPFRSCLGGSDCSTRTYFSKALDPNYNYFTMTDSLNNSSGHVTVVLGEAINPQTNQKEKVAFMDKLQNVPSQKIPSFLQAVSLSLRERGYKLGVPEDVGEHNGLSNMATINHYVAKEIIPKLTEKLVDFVPHQHQYNFENRYSRAYNRLSIKIYEQISFDKDIEVKSGKEYHNFIAPKDLEKNKLISDFLNLRNSKNTDDILRYILSEQVVIQLDKLSLFSIKEFITDLITISTNKRLSFALRKQAFFEVFLIGMENNIKELNINFESFSDAERTQIFSEIKQWSKSSNSRKKRTFNILDNWADFLIKGDLKTMRIIIALKLYDINNMNENKFSMLLLSILMGQKDIVDLLISKFGFNLKESLGFSDIELEKTLEQNGINSYLKFARFKSIIKKVSIKERNRDGSPIIDMVKIPSGTLRKDSSQVEIKQFEIMSVPTTQKMWRGVVRLTQEFLRIKVLADPSGVYYKYPLIPEPSFYKGDEYPVEQVTLNDVSDWIKALNDLSQINHQKIQDSLKELFPNHYIGKKYRLPKTDEVKYAIQPIYEQVSSNDTSQWLKALNLLSKLNNFHIQNAIKDIFKDHSLGKGYTESVIGDEAVFVERMRGLIYNSTEKKNERKRSITLPSAVGVGKPIFLNGHPIYDMPDGSVMEWKSDHYLEPETKNQFPINFRYSSLGFRLSSDIP